MERRDIERLASWLLNADRRGDQYPEGPHYFAVGDFLIADQWDKRGVLERVLREFFEAENKTPGQ